MEEDCLSQGWQFTSVVSQVFFYSKEMFLIGIFCNSQAGKYFVLQIYTAEKMYVSRGIFL